ncbi:hypothetical protein [Planococcus halocryophilus]|uniref:hypothetical protein n=1 Tax=Planococcus halocryophilus TaxID=1215089 RepID=UPI001F114ABB|nr:hypothetical protein [Planococcus halocryophilus]MCH4826741.1 hypothetical protein [Planococcus halocryophilus]
MEIGFYLMITIIFTGSILLAAFDIQRKSEIKLADIQLQREKLALEHKQLEKLTQD